jgi:hypothetical protein
LVGFVVFFGAAILWFQFDEARLPATEGVAVVPKSVLLVTGAQFLAGALAIALGAVAVLWIYNQYLSGWITQRATRRGEKLKRDAEQAEEQVGVATQVVAGDKQDLASAQSRQEGSSAIAAERPDDVDFRQAARKADEEVAVAQAKLESSRDELRAAEKRVKSEHSKLARLQRLSEKRDSVVHFVALVGPIVILEGFLTKGVALPPSDYVWLTLVAGATSLFMFSVWDQTKTNFVWFAVSAFVAIGVFQGVSTYFRTRDSPKIEPMAAITKGPTPVTGYYVAQTSDRVYVGLPAQSHLPARMLVLNRDEVKAIVIGRLTPVAGAMKVASEFSRDLVARNTPAPSLTAVSLANERFGVNKGTTVRFTLSVPATLTITITRVAPGLLSGHSCLAPSPQLTQAHANRCTRTIAVFTLTNSNKPEGAGTIALGGRVGGRRLSPGAYRAVLSASNAGGQSSPITLGFIVF